jgi:hypothetical protein
MEFDLVRLLVRMGIRFLVALLTFGIVFYIDKATKQDNEWNIKYVISISLLYTLFLTILDAVGFFDA